MKKSVWALLAVFMAVSVSSAYANHGGGMQHGGMMCQHGSHSQWGLEGKFFMKSHMIAKNADAIGLSADNVKAIEDLTMETKKALIRQDAEIKIVSMDIMKSLHNDMLNADEVKKLVEKKYDLEKTKELALVDAYAKLKSSLSKDQTAKLKEIWKSKSEQKQHSH